MAHGARQLVLGELYLTAGKPEVQRPARRGRPPKRRRAESAEDTGPPEQGCEQSPSRERILHTAARAERKRILPTTARAERKRILPTTARAERERILPTAARAERKRILPTTARADRKRSLPTAARVERKRIVPTAARGCTCAQNSGKRMRQADLERSLWLKVQGSSWRTCMEISGKRIRQGARLSNGHFGSRYKTRRGARAWRCRFVSGCCSARCETHPPNGKLKKLVPLVRGKHYFADVLPVRVLPSAKLMLPSWKPVRK